MNTQRAITGASLYCNGRNGPIGKYHDGSNSDNGIQRKYMFAVFSIIDVRAVAVHTGSAIKATELFIVT